MAPRRPRKAKILLNIENFLILGALEGCLGHILEGLGGVLEALGGVLEACGSVLEVFGGVLEALEGALEASWRLLKSSWRPRWVKIALQSENIEKHWFLGLLQGVSWTSWTWPLQSTIVIDHRRQTSLSFFAIWQGLGKNLAGTWQFHII